MNPETEINVLLKQSGAIQLESASNTYRLPSGRMWIKPKTYNPHAKKRVLDNLKRFIEEEKRIPGTPSKNAPPYAELLNVTPEMAKQWLEKQILGQRKPEPRRAKLLARLILTDRWKLNGDTFKFDTEGMLMDGQTRAFAIIEANRPVQAFCCYNLERSSFDTIDQQRKRMAANFIAGKYANTRGSLAKLVWHYHQDDFPNIDIPVSVQEIIETEELFQAEIEHIVNIGAPTIQRIHCGTGYLFVLYYYAYESPNKNIQLVEQFNDQVKTGEGLTRLMPAYQYREYFIKLKPGVRVHGHISMALAIKAIRAHINGKYPRVLSWRVNDEKWPDWELET